MGFRVMMHLEIEFYLLSVVTPLKRMVPSIRRAISDHVARGF